MSRLLDWILGRGRDPLAVTQAPSHEPASLVEDRDESLKAQSQALGVSIETMRTMHDARRELVGLVAEDPRAWGFDLLAPDAPRRDITTEFKSRTRLTGSIGESFLQGHDQLLALSPDPLTTPDGTALDHLLQRDAGLDQDAARALAAQLRVTVQVSLGRALDEAAVEHAVRELAWDHELDAARVQPRVLQALAGLVT